MVNDRLLGPIPRVSDSVCMGRCPRICIADKCFGVIYTSGPGSTVWEPLFHLIEGQDIETNPQAVQHFLQGDSFVGYTFYAKGTKAEFHPERQELHWR